MKNELPIIDSCDGCGACCFEQESPPGYAMLLQMPDLADSPELKEDAARLSNLPAEATEELRAYLQRLLNGETTDDTACIWLDKASKSCRYYDHRPSICREFERGSKECHAWRNDYEI